MGLDIGFYKDGEVIFDLHNHDDFLELFFSQKVQQVRSEYTDFYVDFRVLNGVSEALREEFREHGLTEADVPEEVPGTFWHLDARATPWETLLPIYPLLVRILRRVVYERGPLICGWSN
jgi:hypothetical protein